MFGCLLITADVDYCYLFLFSPALAQFCRVLLSQFPKNPTFDFTVFLGLYLIFSSSKFVFIFIFLFPPPMGSATVL